MVTSTTGIGFSARLNELLDRASVVEGRLRANYIAEQLNITPQHSRRMLNQDKPPNIRLLEQLFEIFLPAESLSSLVSFALYGEDNPDQQKKKITSEQPKPKQEKNFIVMGYVVAAIEIRAMELGIDFSSLKKSIRENFWATVYEDAIQNNGKVDPKIVNALLVNFIKESTKA